MLSQENLPLFKMDSNSWVQLKELHPIGTLIEGRVEHYAPFGVFVDIGHRQVRGIILVPEFNEEGIMSPENYPPMGSKVVGVVTAYTEYNNQIRLSLKPS
jgi:ribosomal protein S1